jgi:hypothetical protein
MSIAHADQMESMTSEKIHPINEEPFLREKLSKINPQLDIAFVPTILFELFCWYSMEQGLLPNLADAELGQFFKARNFDNKILEILKDSSNSIKNALLLYDQINVNPQVQKSYQIINNAFVEFLQTILKNTPGKMEDLKTSTLSLIIKELCFSIKDHLFKSLTLSEFYKKNAFLQPLNMMYSNTVDAQNPEKDFFARIIHLEYEAHEQFAGILYRGLGALYAYSPSKRTIVPIIDSMLNMQYSVNEYQQLLQAYAKPEGISSFINFATLRSISYGNSLLGGMFEDPEACALHYFYNPKTLGYALFIDKRSYLKGIAAQIHKKPTTTFESDIFRISPFNTIVSLFAQGEFFHSRSIVYVPKGHSTEIRGIYEGAPDDKLGYYIKEGSPLKYAAYYSNLIARPQFCHILKLYTPGAPLIAQYDLSSEPQKNFIKQLYFQQQENALILKSLVAFEKFYRTLLEKYPEIQPEQWRPGTEEREQLRNAMKELMMKLIIQAKKKEEQK